MVVKVNKKTFSQAAKAISDAVHDSIGEKLESVKTDGANIIEQPITVTTSKVDKNKVEQVENKTVGTVISNEPLCNVGVQASKTINLGNYENVKLGVSIHIPCKYEEIDVTYLAAKNFVDTKMNDLLEETGVGK